MTQKQINELISWGEFPESTRQRELIETHISWVILCDRFVYKIKKPIQYAFLDFSTLALRKHFCNRELELNRRFSDDIYLGVLPVFEVKGHFKIGGTRGLRVDYALKMRKLDREKQMDILLLQDRVGTADIYNLAEQVASFHQSAKILYESNVFDLQEKFNALAEEKEFLSLNLDGDTGRLISNAIQISDTFLHANRALLEERLKNGFFRDGHGDLHTRNIFLLPEPQPFDCIEFNDAYRQIDVLNEVAFLCMDLEVFGRKDLSGLFMERYNELFHAMRNREERQLFTYYKSYRANVRAKVNSLRAKSATGEKSRAHALAEAGKYLKLMESYLTSLDTLPTSVCQALRCPGCKNAEPQI